MKEILFSFIIIMLILTGNFITQNYTSESVRNTSEKLTDLKENLEEKFDKEEKINEKIYNIHKEWNLKYEKLAFYIEHDELEKVETELTDVQGLIGVKQYEEAIPEIDKCIFILNHIKEKNAFSLKNFF